MFSFQVMQAPTPFRTLVSIFQTRFHQTLARIQAIRDFSMGLKKLCHALNQSFSRPLLNPPSEPSPPPPPFSPPPPPPLFPPSPSSALYRVISYQHPLKSPHDTRWRATFPPVSTPPDVGPIDDIGSHSPSSFFPLRPPTENSFFG